MSDLGGDIHLRLRGWDNGWLRFMLHPARRATCEEEKLEINCNPFTKKRTRNHPVGFFQKCFHPCGQKLGSVVTRCVWQPQRIFDAILRQFLEAILVNIDPKIDGKWRKKPKWMTCGSRDDTP